MPWRSHIDESRRLIYTHVSGVLTFAEAAAHRSELARAPAFDPTFSHLLDLRRVDRVDLTRDDVIQLAKASVLTAPCRQAIVAPADVAFGVSRMYSAYRDERPNHEQITICRAMVDACAHLGIDHVPEESAG